MAILNGYSVTANVQTSTFYPKIVDRTSGKLKSIRVTRIKRIITIVHQASGDIIELVAYIHRKQLRYKDSRVNNGRTQVATSQVYSEVKRMLRVDDKVATRILAI